MSAAKRSTTVNKPGTVHGKTTSEEIDEWYQDLLARRELLKARRNAPTDKGKQIASSSSSDSNNSNRKEFHPQSPQIPKGREPFDPVTESVEEYVEWTSFHPDPVISWLTDTVKNLVQEVRMMKSRLKEERRKREKMQRELASLKKTMSRKHSEALTSSDESEVNKGEPLLDLLDDRMFQPTPVEARKKLLKRTRRP